MKIHLIAIGGAVMHNLAIALHKKGHEVTGSDDEIFDPARSKLESFGILPDYKGWRPDRISPAIDLIILGMHARADNPELKKAQETGLKILSFPGFLYEQTKNKKRIVIGGSHGKTTVTSMIMHVLKECHIRFDYMVGAQVEGFDTMVSLSDTSELAIFEGDEYLSSVLDPRPKFHLYKPDIAVITGIAWDHINVFPTFENYREQFKVFIEQIEENGVLIYNAEDEIVCDIVNASERKIKKTAYGMHDHYIEDEITYIVNRDRKMKMNIFGKHNLLNLSAAKYVCKETGINENDFYRAITSFKGASKRLQCITDHHKVKIYLDFAHSPSKVSATIQALTMQYPERSIVACLELHTFSSLNTGFIHTYKDAMNDADIAILYYNPGKIREKGHATFTEKILKESFNRNDLIILTEKDRLYDFLIRQDWRGRILVLMSSGNFGGMNIMQLKEKVISQIK